MKYNFVVVDDETMQGKAKDIREHIYEELKHSINNESSYVILNDVIFASAEMLKELDIYDDETEITLTYNMQGCSVIELDEDEEMGVV